MIPVIKLEPVEEVGVELLACDERPGERRSKQRVGGEMIDIIMDHRVIVKHDDPHELGVEPAVRLARRWAPR